MFSFIHQDQTQNLFFFSGTSIWNSLPEYIKTDPSMKHFKSSYLRWYKQSLLKKNCIKFFFGYSTF